jgi:hypothetical protein
VFDDADLDNAVDWSIRAIFTNAAPAQIGPCPRSPVPASAA